MTDVPRPSAAPTDDHRLPTDHPNPPRRRGRLKSRPGKISNPIDGPTRSRGCVKAVSGGSDASYMLYTNQRWSRRVPKARYAKTATPESIEADRAHLDSTTTQCLKTWWRTAAANRRDQRRAHGEPTSHIHGGGIRTVIDPRT